MSFKTINCQEMMQENKILLIPGYDIFTNLQANPFEARTGLTYYPSTGYFKVDAGHSFDIVHYYYDKEITYSFGSIFFVQALGLNIKEKRLPIDAADGYFGFYFAFADSSKNLKARLRVLHNSAHLADGHLERSSTYSSSVDYIKDFLELTLMHSGSSGIFEFDYYIGASYAIVHNPKELKRGSTHLGLQIHSEKIVNSFYGKSVSLFYAYNFSLTSVPEYIGNNNLMAGIRFGEWNGSAVSVFISYYSGAKLFNQYYDQKEREFSFGFSLE